MPLAEKTEKIFRITAQQKSALLKLRIRKKEDLLFHFPFRYSSISERKNIATLKKGDQAVVFGVISGLKTAKGFRTKISYSEGRVKDQTGQIKIIWFRQPYMAKMFTNGEVVKLGGVVAERKGVLYIANPEIEKAKELPIDTHDSLFEGSGDESGLSYPVYPESRGITSRWLYYTIQKLLQSGAADALVDPLPPDILKIYNLPTLRTALFWIHNPKEEAHANSARKRFAFEEVFFIQLARQMARKDYEGHASFNIETKKGDIEQFLLRFPFRTTKAQENAIKEILSDLSRGVPMMRLLEGDVGSGKTLVAAAAAYAVITGKKNTHEKFQICYMAPTEILATQHFESFIEYFKHLPVSIGLLTGSVCKKFPSKVDPTSATKISRAQLTKWAREGEIDILIGTHALIEKTVGFRHLALVIVDEQHRFGTNQRAKLAQKETRAPHFLSMTATPIPRTLALTIYGDLDLTLLDEMPVGRKRVETEIIIPSQRKKMYEKIREEVALGRQAFFICPRIDEPDPEKENALNAKSVKEEAVRLKKNIFPEFEIAILHGKMLPAEKEKAMKKFSDGTTQILVATSVVEVGVNVPNATLIAIEGAERFGLAQLHQLRGRVARSDLQAFCFLVSDSGASTVAGRLKALKTAKNGFELAEADLTLRGAGELFGKKQWGISDVGMEAIKNLKMVEAARNEAKAILETDPALERHPAIKTTLAEREKISHFE